MKHFIYILTATLLFGCSKGNGNGEEKQPEDIELSHWLISLSELTEYNLEPHHIDIFDLPYNDTIRIIGGNGGYSVTKVWGSLDEWSESNTKITTAAQVVGDSSIVVTISGPTREEYAADESMRPFCREYYVITDSMGKQAAFEIIDELIIPIGDIYF